MHANPRLADSAPPPHHTHRPPARPGRPPWPQVRLLVPGVFVGNVLLRGPGVAAPLRVAVDCADKAFDLDPWATPTTQVA